MDNLRIIYGSGWWFFATPLNKIRVFVNWDDEIPNCFWKFIKFMFQSPPTSLHFDDCWYPLVNVHITIENHIFLTGHLTASMSIFNSYVKLPEGILFQHITLLMAMDHFPRHPPCFLFQSTNSFSFIPSGKRLHNHGTSPCYSWVNPRHFD